MLPAYDKHYYTVFGLYVESDILLSELLLAPQIVDIPDVSIRLGRVPSSITDPIEKTVRYEVKKDEFIFRVIGVGAYYVVEGRSIIVEPAEEAEERLVRIFLLGTAFGALLMQRGILPIHGPGPAIGLELVGIVECA